MNAYMTRRIVVKKLVTLGEGNDQKPLTLFMDDPVTNKLAVFYYVNYGLSIIASRVSQILSVMKT